MISKYYFIMLLAFIHYQTIFSQGFMSPAGVMISHTHDKGSLMLSYTYMATMMKNNLAGTKSISDEDIWNDYIFAPQDMSMEMHMLMGMYGLTDRFSVMVMADFLTGSMNLTLPPGTVLVHDHGGNTMNIADQTRHMHATSGFGDIKIWSLLKLHESETSSLVFSAGLNIPTGKYNNDAGQHAIYPGERHPYMMQLGTGSLDFLPGITFLKYSDKFTWSTQVLATIRPFYNTIGYHYGSDFTLNIWAAYHFSSNFSASARLEGYIGGPIKGYDPKVYTVIEPDANPKNYGGERASSFLGVNYYIDKSFMRNSKVEFEAGIPFYQNVKGIQLSTQYALNAGIVKTF